MDNDRIPHDALDDHTEIVAIIPNELSDDSLDDHTGIAGSSTIPHDPLDDHTEIVAIIPNELPDDSLDELTEIASGTRIDLSEDAIDLRDSQIPSPARLGSRYDSASRSQPSGAVAHRPPPARTQAEPRWQPPDRPRLPEAERSSHRSRVAFRPVIALAAVLLLVICIFVGYIALRGDDPAPTEAPIAEVQSDIG